MSGRHREYGAPHGSGVRPAAQRPFEPCLTFHGSNERFEQPADVACCRQDQGRWRYRRHYGRWALWMLSYVCTLLDVDSDLDESRHRRAMDV